MGPTHASTAAALTVSEPRSSEGTSAALAKDTHESNPGAPRGFYLILINVTKRKNVGTVLRCAAAFGARGVVIIGDGSVRRARDLATFGAHGSDKHLTYHFANSLAAAITLLKTDLGVARVLGVEIRADAKSVSRPAEAFGSSGNLAFILGAEGDGLHPKHAAQCDGFVYIPQHGDGTASLNVAVAAGIIFHRFTDFVGADERSRTNEKYDVSAVERNAGGDDELIRKERAARKEDGIVPPELDGAFESE